MSAISSADEISIELERLPVIEPRGNGSLMGKVVKDWSQVVGCLGFPGGAISGGLGYANDNFLLELIGVVVVVAVFVLFCARISCLKPEKELERQVVALNDTVNALQRNQTKLLQVRKELLQALGEAKESIASLGQVLKIPLDDLKNITDQIGEIEVKMRVVIDLYHRYKATTETLSSEIGRFKESNTVSASGLNNLRKNLKSLDLVEDELSEGVDEYHDALTFHKSQNRQLRNVLGNFKADFVEIQNSFVAMQSELAELADYVRQLDETDDKYRDGAERFQKGRQNIQENVLPEIERLQNDLEQAINDLKD